MLLQKFNIALKRIKRDISSKPWYLALSLILILVSLFLNFFSYGLILGIILLWVGYNWSSTIFPILACLLLIYVPFLIQFDQRFLSTQISIWIYFLMLITVIIETLNYFINQKKVDIKPVFKALPGPGINLKLLTSSISLTEDKADNIESFQSSKNQIIATDIELKPSTNPLIYRLAIGLFFIFILFTNWVIFDFQGLPNFADLTTYPFIYNIENNFLDLKFWFSHSFNFFVNIGVNPITVAKVFFFTYFSLGVITNFYALKKILNYSNVYFFKTTGENQDYSFFYQIFASTLLVYNPFILERFWMGQYFTILGHLFFLPILVGIISSIEKFFVDNKKLSSILEIAFFSALLSWISVHHGAFLVILALISFLVILSRKAFVSLTRLEISAVRLISLKTSFLIVIWIIIWSSLLPFISRFDPTLSSPPTDKFEIIRAFSLYHHEGSNAIIQSLIGSGSWHLPGLTSRQNLFEAQGQLITILNWYFNEYIATFFVLFFGILFLVLLGIKLFKDKYFDLMSYIFIVTIIFSIILNFGFSLGFESVNSWFYRLPLTYILREPGKFYSLFLITFITFVAKNFSQIPIFLREILVYMIMIFTFSSVFNWIPLSTTINYVEYPSIFEEVSELCRSNDLVLYLPNKIYIEASYSPESYIVNPVNRLFDCKVIKTDLSFVVNYRNNEEVFLQGESDSLNFYNKLLELQNTKSVEKIQANLNNLLFSLKRQGVTILVIDSYYYPEINYFNSLLSKQQEPYLKEGDVSVYILE